MCSPFKANTKHKYEWILGIQPNELRVTSRGALHRNILKANDQCDRVCCLHARLNLCSICIVHYMMRACSASDQRDDNCT